MQCPNCGAENNDTFRFCMKCGNPLAVVAPESEGVQFQPATQTETPGETPSPPQSIPAPVQIPVPYIPPQTPAVQPSPPPYQPQQTGWTPPTHTAGPTLGQQAAYLGASGASALNLWGPFAGYGTRRRHVGWLMDNKGDQARALIDKVKGKFAERSIPGAQVQQRPLVARGLVVETRPYFLLQRGLVSLGLYISQFGKDLFISLASYLKPPISNFRVLVVAIMGLFWLYTTFIFTAGLRNAMNNYLGALGGGMFGGVAPSASGLMNLICLIGPLGTLNSILFYLFLIYSTYKWLVEKDFLAGLRVQPNEFNEDDLMALEKAVEQTVRLSLDEIGLDPAELKPTGVFEERRLI